MADQLSLATPRLALEGERDGWPYIVMTRLQGRSLEEVLPTLAEEELPPLLRRLGEVIAEVQRVPAGDLLRLEPQWPPFLARQVEGCRRRHERLGLPGRFLDEIEAYVAESAPLVRHPTPPVILTGEYIPENLIVSRHEERWRLSGLIDFGDVMTGWGEYDLLGPGAFLAAGVADRVRNLLQGYGYSRPQDDPLLPRRLGALLLLHRFSEPLRQIRIADWPAKAATLRDLERLLWPI